jgi:hypothetical protein
VDAATIAKRINVDRSWVYANAPRLGALRLGDGPKARLRFDPARVDALLRASATRTDERREPHIRRPRRITRRERSERGAPLLPIRVPPHA